MYREKKLILSATHANVIKNFIIVVVAGLLYKTIQTGMYALPAEKIKDYLLIISILLVSVCFANFAFSYEYSLGGKKGRLLLSHFATFFFILLIALLLEVVVIASHIIYTEMYIMTVVFSVLLYIGLILYDFWDLFRIFHE
jgi:hypothetical protein